MSIPEDHGPARRYARLTGVLLLVMTVCAGFAQGGVLSALHVPGDSAATAEKVLASANLYRAGLLGFLAAYLCDVPVSVLLYVLFRSSGQPLALTMAAFRLVYTAAVGAVLIFHFGALLALDSGATKALDAATRQGLAAWSLELFLHGFDLALLFFAVHLLLLAVLIWRSSLLPRVFGPLMALAGAAYLVGGTTRFLAPSVNAALVPVLMVPMMFEVLLALWLTIRGVKVTPAPA